MPKRTDRTKLIRTTLTELLSEKTDWDAQDLRQACLDRIVTDPIDEKDLQSWKDSIRRTVVGMKEFGEPKKKIGKTPRKKPRVGKGEAEKAEETAAPAPSFATEPAPDAPNKAPGETAEPTAPAPEPIPADAPTPKEESRPSVKMPKAKQMNEFLATALSEDSPAKEDALVSMAVSHFGATGEQVNGVRGLVIQQLKDQQKSGTVLFTKTDGYRKAPAVPQKEETSAPVSEEKPAPAPAPVKPTRPAVPQVPVKRVTPTRVKAEPRVVARRTDGEKRPSRLMMNENRFAEKINLAGGAFFTEFVARLFEAYYRSHGVTVCGRYVVDGSDDKGVDVILQTVDELGLGDVILIQAKTRSSGQVSLKELREFFGVMAAEHATHGMFVTTSTFTTDAVTFARSNPGLAAVDKYKLFALASRLGIGLVGEGDSLTVDPALFG